MATEHQTSNREHRTPRLFVPAMLSGLLLWASFFPLDLGPLAFVALVPWLALVRAENVTRRRRYCAAFAGGLCFYLPALQWIRVAHPAMYASWIFMAVYCSLYFVLALALLRRFDRVWKLPLAITLPIVWVALEYCRSHFPTGFPFLKPLGAYQLIGFGWYSLGYTQHATGPLLQLAELGGVYLVSALICCFNGAAFEWFVRQPWLRRAVFRYPIDNRIGFFREMWISAAAAFALVVSVGYGTSCLQHPEFNEGPRIVALQGNIPQDVKIDNKEKLLSDYTKLAQRAMLRADLVIWPETCCPNSWYDANGITDSGQLELLKKFQREFFQKTPGVWGRHTLIGLTTYEFEPGRETKPWQYNSALFVTPDQQVTGRYDKIHLVPMGEYVPMGETFPFLQAFTPYQGDYSCKPGEHLTKFKFSVGEKQYSFGCIICYEDSDPYLARQYVRNDPVDFLVNISNDGWFNGTEEHEQHLAISRFRAVECRRTVVRAVNMGISAVIDPDGKIISLPGDDWAKSKKMEELVVAKVKLDTRTTLYAKLGDWLPQVCWVVIGVVLVVSIVRKMRQRGATIKSRV